MKSEQRDMCEKACFIVPPKIACVAGPALRLLGVPTARGRARDLRSVNAGAGSLFFAFQKKFESAPAPQLAIA